MKRSIVLFTLAIVLVFSTHAEATFIDIGNGSYAAYRRITWPQDIDNTSLSLVWNVHAEGMNVSGIDSQQFSSYIFVIHSVLTNLGNINTRWNLLKGGDSYHSAPVTEPSTMLLLGSGLLGIAGFFKKQRKGLT